jgi:alkaline phosphatase
MSDRPAPCRDSNRRAFLQQGALVLTATAVASGPPLLAADRPPLLSVGLVTDLHYGDKAPAGTRYYRETLAKLAEAATQFGKDKPALIVELGDLIDAADSVEQELGYLKTINRQFSAISADRHYVLGNHCVDTLTKDEFLGAVGQQQSYYSFDRAGCHFIVLDACFRSDGQPYGRKNSSWDDANIPAEELEWLADDLQQASGPVIVLAHQRLDGSDRHCVKNAAEVRRALEDSRKVLAVFQGHSHQNDYRAIADIHYCTLAAMVEGSGAASNGYSLLEVYADRTLAVRGFRRQKSYRWPQA